MCKLSAALAISPAVASALFAEFLLVQASLAEFAAHALRRPSAPLLVVLTAAAVPVSTIIDAHAIRTYREALSKARDGKCEKGRGCDHAQCEVAHGVELPDIALLRTHLRIKRRRGRDR